MGRCKAATVRWAENRVSDQGLACWITRSGRDADELGPDLISVKVLDPNAKVDREMTLAAGDQVRVQEGKIVLGYNGDVVEVL